MTLIVPGPDGYCHPATEEELRELILHARAQKKQLRVRGSAHSFPKAIYTDGHNTQGAASEDFDVLLDRYRAVTWLPLPDDPGHALVEIEAGCHLGKNPFDPAKSSTWENSLNWQLQRAGYALEDLGGISHQTISGFLSTSSSGGSLTYAPTDSVVRLRFIDGTGEIHDVSRDDPDPAKRELFYAAGVSMGLLGVLSKVWLRVRKTYNVFGSETTSPISKAAVDLFGRGTGDRPSLGEFFRQAPYSRIMWWPQHGFERVQVWQATRMDPSPGFTPRPYQELGRAPQLAALAGSLFYTILGNLDAIADVPDKLTDWFAQLEGTLEGAPDVNGCRDPRSQTEPSPKHSVDDVLSYLRSRIEVSLASEGSTGEHKFPASPQARALIEGTGHSLNDGLPRALAAAITKLVELLLTGGLESPLAQPLAEVFRDALPYVIKHIIAPFVSDGSEPFWDTWMCGLPMDNQMDDRLWPTSFTELWVPMERSAEVMGALQELYRGGGDPVLAYEHTGAFSCELYSARSSPFWMSPSYGRDTLRINVFWFRKNAGSASDEFFPRFWRALKPFGLRPHWGKVLPPASPEWTSHYRAEYPMLEAFLALRNKLDPDGVFLTQYWRKNLGVP
jgi:hypothetical protein